MKRVKKQLLMVLPVFAVLIGVGVSSALTGCETTTTTPEISFSWASSPVVAATTSSVSVEGIYFVDNMPEDVVTEAGVVLFEKDGDQELGRFIARSYLPLEDVVGARFETRITGLEPETEYDVELYAIAGGEVYSDPDVRRTVSTLKEDGGEGYTIAVSQPSVSDLKYNSASLSGAWNFTTGSAVVSEAGFMYRAAGASAWAGTLKAAGTSSPVTYSWTSAQGLASSAAYEVATYVKIAGATHTSAVADFTTPQYTGGGDPDPLDQFAWPELPRMKEIDGVEYATHYVSENGGSSATKTTPGRKRSMTIALDTKKLQPLWVAYPMHSWYDGDAGRNDSWAYDPNFDKEDQSNLGDGAYTGPYSRGHMLASGSRQKSVAMNKQTFYYTNMAPQTQNSFNGGIWNQLEQKVEQAYGYRSDTLYVVTGSVFNGSVTTQDGSGKTMPVPSNFYKAFLKKKSGVSASKTISQCSASELQCAAFYFVHQEGYYENGDDPTEDHMVSVSDIEEITGFEFFPMLSPEARVVKESFNASDWGM
ncbi:MAG: DNA/RNA non-specific endonuclease [Alistipes sp.]|nr:DNA/RNA non-specific endonuclease [Alistipes sp.]